MAFQGIEYPAASFCTSLAQPFCKITRFIKIWTRTNCGHAKTWLIRLIADPPFHVER
jgi:hypothetical protein